MKHVRAVTLALWLLAVAVATAIIARAQYSTDLSAFLPRAPSASEQLLVDQLQNGLAARLILIGIEGGDAAQRAQAAAALAASLRGQDAFLAIDDGDATGADSDRAFLFEHRYALSPQVTPERFSVEGLQAAIEDSLDLIRSPVGPMAKSLLRSDPTGETLQILDGLDAGRAPRRERGVWSSPNGQRALLIAETRAAGSDTDGEQQALTAIRSAFAAAAIGKSLRLLMSGPAVFAVAARATIQHEVKRLSLLSSALIVTLLLIVYRSVSTLLLGLLPVLSGALAGIVAVALGSGIVHGITLGFGITLIGESVDYSIYLFVQSQRREQAGWHVPERLWPTLWLGMATSVCGFASLLPSSFPGLAQLGLFTVAGLVAAAAVTRWVLPTLSTSRLTLRDPAPLGAAVARGLSGVRLGGVVLILGVVAGGWLTTHRGAIWNRDLAALSPVSASAQALDGELRSELGAPDISNLIVVSANDEDGALARAEKVSLRLDGLVRGGQIGGYDSPSRYLPSHATQAARRASLPDAATLRQRLKAATADLPLRPEALDSFVDAVNAARQAAPIEHSELQHTSMQLALDALLWPHSGQWYALLPLRAPRNGVVAAGDIDIGQVRAAVQDAAPGAVFALNMKQQTDALYDHYLKEAVRASLIGLLAILVLLAAALRSALRVARVLLPLVLAVLLVAAGLLASGVTLTILHLIGLLLIVAVGSNYALFFDRLPATPPAEAPRLLASLVIANAATVIGFGVLAFSTVPVLAALGTTVAPGTLLALWFSGLLAPRAPLAAAAAEIPERRS
jgi:predicted exporter